ncbi:MAG: hypothetical protein VX777_07085 [Chlamydiota bacterium]|nr:hypothetical protein [Chlamydiota bacterium]
MKFNKKYLSIPPYISTAWSNVTSLHMSGNQLVVSLADGSHVYVPDLDLEDLEALFEVHSNVLEDVEKTVSASPEESKVGQTLNNELFKNGGSASFKIGMGGIEGMDSLGFAMQHNPDFADAPDLPEELLHKIGSIAKILSPDEALEVPQSEPHCNCPHCQIARAINGSIGNPVSIDGPRGFDDVSDDEVTEEDLKFEQWEIQQSGDQLFTVIDKLNVDKQYKVFLGSPVGCTCGEEGCDHILAVLHS